MKKILATAFIFTSLITTAEAAQQADNGIVVGVDYTYFTISPYYGDANPGAINASIGYKFNLTNNFSLTPEYKIGTGLTDDSTRRVVSVFASVDGVLYEFEDIDVEIDNFMLFSLRAQYELDNGIYFYIAPSYARTKISLSGFSAPTIGLRENNINQTYSDFGYKGGIGFNLNKHWGADISYQKNADIDGFSAAIRYSF